MGLFEVAKDTLKEIPMADILRERLSLALDQSAFLERKVSELQTQLGRLEAQLETERQNHQKAQKELHALKSEHSEEIRISHCVEFRKSKRTGDVWMAFCPVCHMPAVDSRDDGLVDCTAMCGWNGVQVPNNLRFVIQQIRD